MDENIVITSKSNQLKNLLSSAIVAGDFKVGARIPSEHELCRTYQISRSIVREVLSAFVHEGLIYRLQGKGTFVAQSSLIADRVTKKIKTIGMALANNELFRYPAFAEVLSGISKVAEEYNYLIQQTTTNFKSREKNFYYLNALVGKRVEGLVIYDLAIEDKELLRLKEKRVPFVLIDRHVPEEDLNCILVDYREGFYKAVKYLFNLGHRRMALILGWLGYRIDREKVESYRRALKDCGLKYNQDFVVEISTRFGEGERVKRIHNLLDLKASPTAIMTSSDEIAVNVAKMIKNRGLKIPEDISFLIFADSSINKAMEPPMTSVAVPFGQIGELAGKMLINLIEAEGKKLPCNQVIVKPELIIRESCRRIKLV